MNPPETAVLGKFKRGLRLIRECHRALLQAADEASLLREVCRIVVELGGYRLAWVGWAEQDATKSIRPAGYVGIEAGYLNNLKLTWAETEPGRGPTGTAIRTGEPVIYRNTLTDPRYELWQTEARGWEYGSTLALPLCSNGRVVGAFTISAAAADAFDPVEVDVLKQLAADLSFGVTALRCHAEAEILRRQHTEAALRESEDTLRALLNATPESVMLLDTQGMVLTANDVAALRLGLTVQEFEGACLYDLWPAEVVAGRKAHIDRVIRTGRMVRHEDSRDGISFETYLHPVLDAAGQVTRIAVLALDVTERRRAEAEIEGLARFPRENPNPVLRVAGDGTLMYANASSLPLLDFLGCSTGQPLPEDWRHLIQEVITSGESREIEVFFDNRAYSLIFVPIVPMDYVNIYGRDITAYRRTEAALRRSEENYRLLVSNIPAIVSQGYVDGWVDFFDDKIEALTGYTREEFLSRKMNWLDLVLPEDLPAMRRAFLQALKRGRFYVREYRIRARDGRVIWIRERSQIVLNQAGQVDYISGVAFDITEQKQEEETRLQLETQLRQAQKMEAIGTLAGGIAHDFNNILSAIMGYTELGLLCLEQPVPAASELRAHLREALQAGARARDLVTQILTFSRRTELERKPVQVYSILKETLKFLRASMPATIEIRQRLDPNSGIVLADPVQIHQLLLNLGTNAYHAMHEKGGVLEVELAAATVDEELAKIHPELEKGDYIRVKVKDTGRGMDPATLERIFDPFFTTKRAGEGTGLGLSVVHGVVKSLGGAILVDSKLGRGSTFQVYLPRHHEAVVLECARVEPIPAGREHVLFVDDEPQLCEIAQRMLEHLGYRVTAYSNSLEALKEFQAHPKKFDLVITDLTMPHLTGVELAREMLKMRPDIPIILASGFSDSITPERARDLGIQEYLMKPMALRQLGEAIRRVLDSSQ